jgi:hypothetical protein
MNTRFRIVALASVVTFSIALQSCSGCKFNSAVSSRTITASTDKNGQSFPASAVTNRRATVTCINAISGSYRKENPTPGCNLNGYGVWIGGSINTGPGLVTLSCHGTSPLLCTARIDE